MSDRLERYKILVDLLKHQDAQINSVLAWNAVIQLGLLASLQAEVIQENPPFLLGIAILGIILSIFWFLSGLRQRSYTTYCISRIKILEKSGSDFEGFKVFTDGEAETKKGWSKVLYLYWVPGLLGFLWLSICMWTICLLARGATA